MKKILFSLLFGMLAASTLAQNAETESREILFQVATTLHENDSLIAYIQLGKNAGIEKGLFGRCYTSYRSGINEDYTELGSCKIWWVNDTSALAVIDLYKTGSSRDSIRTGDFIALTLSVPKKQFRSIFYDLATKKIDLTSNAKEELYNLVDILRNDSREMEKKVLASFVIDIKETYDYVKDMPDLESLKTPLTEGRYKGRSVFDVMRNVTEEDVRNFLLFVKAYPFKYMGISYKTSETFATWVLNNSPTGSEEIKELILAGPAAKTKLDKLLGSYKRSILKDQMAASVCDAAIAFSTEKRTAEANRLLEGIRYVTTAINDTAGKAACFLTLAQIAQDNEKYSEAVAHCIEGLKIVSVSKDRDMEMQFLFKKAFCQYKNSQYTSALATVAEAEKKIALYRPSFNEATYHKNLRKRYEYAGWIQYSSGDYVNALTSFRNGIEINNKTNTYTSKSNNATNYWYMGKIYTKQSEYKKALPAFDTSYAMYVSTNSMKDAGFVINDIGWTLFKMKEYEQSLKKHEDAYDVLMKAGDLNNAGYSRSMIGQNLWNLGKYAEAIESHKSSIALRREAANVEGQAFSWEQLGELYLLSGEKNKALTSFDSALHYYALIKDSGAIAENYTSIGKVYEGDNDLDAAIKHYTKAYNYLKTAGSKDVLSDAVFKLGIVLFEKDPVQAKKYFEECLLISRSIGNKSNQLYSLVNLGALNYTDPKAQQKLYGEALALSKEINTADMIGYCYSRMAAAFQYQLYLDEALDHYQKAMVQYESVDKKEFAQQIINKGNVLIVKGDFDEALKEFDKAIAQTKTSNNLIELADALSGAAFVLNLQGNYQAAKQALDSSSAIYHATGNKIKLSGMHESWGQYYQSIGEYGKSIEAYLKADSILIAEKKPAYRQSVMTNMGVTYFHQADFRRSLYYHKESDKLQLAEVQDETFLICKVNIAECLYYLKEPLKAEAMLKQVYPLGKSRNANRVTSTMAIILGRIELERNNLKQAEKYLQEGKAFAYKSNEKEKIVESLIYLAKVQNLQNQPALAEANLKEAIAVAKKFGSNTYGWEALYELGMMYYRANKLKEAIVAFKDAVDIVENTSTNIYGGEEAVKLFKSGEKKTDLYTKLVTSLAKNGQEQDAWAYANKSNMAALKDLQGGAPQQLKDEKKNTALQQANSLLQQKTNIEKSITELELKGGNNSGQLQALREKKEVLEKGYLNYIDSMVEKYPDLRAYFADNVHPEEFKKYKNKLPADAAAILYLVNDNQLLIFTVTNEKIGIRITEIKDDFNRLINDFLIALSAPTDPSETGEITLRSNRKGTNGSGISFVGTSEKLYSLLIADILEDVKGKKKLCIIPNGKLSNIPFQCLGKRGAGADTSFQFLVQDFNIFYTNSLDIFTNEQPKAKNLASFAAYGNPDKTLPNSKNEVVEIGKILNLKGTEDVHIEDDATEFKAKRDLAAKKYIHFATHGVLDYSKFSNSYLVMASEKSTDDDGKLRLMEIKELTMEDCDLVTLSACETAVTNESVKGWYISPANSFMKNGVRSVVASLWSVDDIATSKLMTQFYTNLQTMEKGEALRRAQESLSRDPRYTHPFFWGAFVLYGDWR